LLRSEPEVLIVGAGPTGLTLAGGLLANGVAARVVDKAVAPAGTSRALGLQPRGIEVVDRLGALNDLPERALQVERIVVHINTKGNVEAELASEGSEEDAGCGCAYPDYVGDDVVERSNQIIGRLRATAARFPELVGRLGALPRYLTAGVAGERVGIVHGDPESLAGWRLALEAMEPGDPQVRRQVGWRGQPTTPTELLDWFGRAEVSVFASTHTGLPYAQAIADGRRRRLIINNGAAGLPAFAGTTYGVMTRLSSDPRPPPDSLYGTAVGALRCDALPVRFDHQRWQKRFLAQWPPGSPGHRSYFGRITGGTHLRLVQAARGGVQLTAPSEQP
jgi:hypothetical protein